MKKPKFNAPSMADRREARAARKTRQKLESQLYQLEREMAPVERKYEALSRRHTQLINALNALKTPEERQADADRVARSL